MNLEKSSFEFEKELESSLIINIGVGYDDFIPEEFKQDPFVYFERNGENIKPWKEKIKVKQFLWKNNKEIKMNELRVVAKLVSLKGEIIKSGDPFYEYNVMQIIQELNLPGAKTVAKIEYGDRRMILMERIPGINFSDLDETVSKLKTRGYNDEDLRLLKEEAVAKMNNLKDRFEEAGIIKDNWKLKDMVADIDVENKTIKNIVPTDWERTKIDQAKLNEYKRKLSNNY